MHTTLIKRLIAVLGFTALLTGLLGFQPAAASDDTITVESVSYAKDSTKASASDAVNVLVDGATQVTWEVPNHKVKVTKKKLRKAPRIKVNATGANSSKVIYKKTKGAKVVVLKKRSCVRNTGRENNLRVGFVWCLKHNAVLVLDKSRQYRHSHNIVGGRLVKTCLNFIGGKVPMRAKVIQVRFKGDLEQEATVSAEAEVTATVEASKECPGGKVYGKATASARATASAVVRSKLKYMVTSVSEKKTELIATLESEVKATAKAKAKASITITCSDAPEQTPKPKLLEIDTINDVLVNNSRTITVSGHTAPKHTGELLCTANTGSITAGKRQNVSGSFDKQITYTAGDEPGHDKVTCTVTQDDGQTDSISTNQFEVRPAPIDPP
jgi:hypothetical protein